MNVKYYCDYLEINERYYSSVSEELMAGGFVDWRDFYPHKTFQRLLRDTASILRRQQKLSIWVEGPYGVGKSYAVLAVKQLLDSPEEEMRGYFEDNYQELDMDLFNTIQGAKEQGPILTVHKVGSSNVRGDNALVMHIQEAIKEELKKRHGFTCEDSLKDAMVGWLSDEINAKNFNNYIEGRYRVQFGTDTAQTIVEKLNRYKGDDLANLTRKVFEVAEAEGITALRLTVDHLREWIVDVIERNKLKSLVFIWDEFTEYFLNNRGAITGFQRLCELSQVAPFHFIIVTHQSSGLFSEKDDSRKIIDRFINPTCSIDLPENMAFKLMAKTIRPKQEPVILEEWKATVKDLMKDMRTVVESVTQSVNITTQNVEAILPIHPYTALILKHLSTMFKSNQRSMFEFLVNKRADDSDHGFRWFLEEHGPESDENFLTIDMLWDFFYADGKANLESGVKSLLSIHDAVALSLNARQSRVLKTVLLLQCISERNLDSVELLRPTARNICSAYEGSDLGSTAAENLADSLVSESILYAQNIGHNNKQYVAKRSGANASDLKGYLEEFRKEKTTRVLVDDNNIVGFLALSGYLNMRFQAIPVTETDITRIVNSVDQEYDPTHIPLLVAFAKDSNERAVLVNRMRELIATCSRDLVMLDTTSVELTLGEFEGYIKQLAEEKYWRGRDPGLADQYRDSARQIINEWIGNLKKGAFQLLTKKGVRKVAGLEAVAVGLKEISLEQYPLGVEQFSVAASMYDENSIALGVECGVSQETQKQYSNKNEAVKLENALKGVWKLKGDEEPDKTHPVYQIQCELDKMIQERFDKDGQVSFEDIFAFLQNPPYGFIPCNLTAFIVGFLLRNYANDTYRWSNNQLGDIMSPDKLKIMVTDYFKHLASPRIRYNQSYIVKMTPKEKQFLSGTASAFRISPDACANIQKTREEVRGAIKRIGYPLWTAKLALEEKRLDHLDEIIQALDLYSTLCNNSDPEKTDVDIASSIGAVFGETPEVIKALRENLSSSTCKAGLLRYLTDYRGGALQQKSKEISRWGHVVKDIKEKLEEDSSWVWKNITIDEQIDLLLLEYSIVAESNKHMNPATNIAACLIGWGEKLRYFKLPYEGIRHDVPAIRNLLKYLYEIYSVGQLQPQHYSLFLRELKNSGDEFSSRFRAQKEWFRQKFEIELSGMADSDIDSIFAGIPLGVFGRSMPDYQAIVTETIERHRKNMLMDELKSLWTQKSGGHLSPEEWSGANSTPILCLVDDKELETASRALVTVSKKSAGESDIHEALRFLKHSPLFKRMNSAEAVDKAFREKVVGNRPLIEDLAAARKALADRTNATPAHQWYPKPADIDKTLDQYCESIYFGQGGCQRALDKIEEMDSKQAKDYLKTLIREHTAVGLKVLNDNQ